MKYIGKKIIVGIIVLIVVLIGGFAAWMLVPASAGSMLRSTVVVEQKVWQEVCVAQWLHCHTVVQGTCGYGFQGSATVSQG